MPKEKRPKTALIRFADRMSDPRVRFRWFMWPAVFCAAAEAGFMIVFLIWGPREWAVLPAFFMVTLSAVAWYCRSVAPAWMTSVYPRWTCRREPNDHRSRYDRIPRRPVRQHRPTRQVLRRSPALG